MERIGRYEILEKIGEGGMGTVYKARQPTLNKIVALKVLAEVCAKDEELVERFMREARIMANLLDYRHVVQVFDLAEEGGKHFYTMEYVPLSLAEYIGDYEVESDRTRKVKRESKVIPVKEAVEITRQVLEGLRVIHGVGVVHRDISPQNVMLVKDEDGIGAKITDFGIAGVRDSGLTKTGMKGVGKEVYAAPEQWEDFRKGDERSDIYSVGILLYRMVTGRLPIGLRPKQAKELNPEVTESLNDVILKATEQEPGGRYQSGQRMMEALRSPKGGPRVPRKETVVQRKPPDEAVIPRYRLRRKGEQIPEQDIRGMLKKFEFYDSAWNPSGYFRSDLIDNGDGTVTDSLTGLMWEKSGSDRWLGYKDAEGYVREQNRRSFAGYNDWRLPTLEELCSLLRTEKVDGLHIGPLFDRDQKWCWSADSRTADSVWLVYFNHGEVDWCKFGNVVYVRAVRSC